MNIAFYAPMKPPDHPVPSGDRRMADLLMAALSLAGHRIELSSRLRSRDGGGDPARQARLASLGAALARRLVRRFETRPKDERPAAWLTYHLYYKAPDWIGPAVCEALAIPYLVAEASVAGKRAGGPWDLGHRATLAALERAAAVIALNPRDVDCLPDPHRVRALRPFLDCAPYRAAAADRQRHRAELAKRLNLDPELPWLLAVAMMRRGDKLASYRALAQSLAELRGLPWQLVLVGDGPARGEVAAAFSQLPVERIRWAGELSPDALPPVYAACDLLVWPAVREAYGMALLEAQASGLPVVAGANGAVPEIVHDGVTGALARPEDPAAFTEALRGLLGDPARRRRMAAAAPAVVEADHGLPAAARRLDAILAEAVAGS
jgi:glycosyltransferase involved in cell wall biosynthesis